ncbi:MAG: hypothetical protein A3B31_01030 [Candidatus Komeilibacteria bacterium RIFCSPLOWO2_01_FULL_53_11]|uniref:Nudix hydrolase domain-containing protein n=1 Tax=Candidatus Komeilibacteria bacterium RIFCSPLOWO2_01_FULL_53_11 TaxID=1798552 RepID=A0A1G2BQR1_9BACT|nr:MAG: hypothetical protein A3B31_01030 [Candidatus Komeilibacteria bacterium RIFCSPLOWO2_01_FULL_53_11]
MSKKFAKKAIRSGDTITCYDVDRIPHECAVSDLIFRPSIYGLLIRDGKILLLPQWDGYDFPGGGLDVHETIEEALVREFWEETGFTVRPKQLINCQSALFYSKVHRKPFNAILMHYTVTRVSGELSTDNLEPYEKNFSKLSEWVDLDTIDTVKFINDADSTSIIRKALATLKSAE